MSVSLGGCNNIPHTGGLNERHPSPPGDHTSEVKGSPGWAPCRGSRGGSSPPLPASGVSGRPSLGWWLPPSRLCLRLHVASPLRPCLSSSMSYKDPVPGFKATPIQEEPHLRLFTSIWIVKNDLFSSRSLISYICQDPLLPTVISTNIRD